MNKKLLLIDDEKQITDSLKSCFQLEGYDVYTTNDSLKALDIIKENNINAVITDITMPGINGIELTAKIKEFNPNLPVIMLTANNEIDLYIQAKELGAYEYVIKPVEFPVLLKIVSHLWNSRLEVSMEKWRCILCDYRYDHELGDHDGGIPAGTKFEDLPEDWVCPLCGAKKSDFRKIAFA